ncbi:MAG: hypothetical protein WAO08_25850 [Hyphomicrobiaceae bacterium]
MRNIGGKLPPWAKLTGWAILGLALVAINPVFGAGHWRDVPLEICRDAGIAVLVGTFLAFTIDRWFSAELHEDVFEAVLGYIPPPEFVDEIRSLIRYQFVCQRHVMTFRIEELENNCVRVTTATERTLKNVTSRSAKQNAHLHMDEWGFECERSKILECYIVLEDGRRFVAKEVPQDDATILAMTDEIAIDPQQTVRVYLKCSEVRRQNDEINFQFGAPTLNCR